MYGIYLASYRSQEMGLWVYGPDGKRKEAPHPSDLSCELSDYRSRNPDGIYLVKPIDN